MAPPRSHLEQVLQHGAAPARVWQRHVHALGEAAAHGVVELRGAVGGADDDDALSPGAAHTVKLH